MTEKSAGKNSIFPQSLAKALDIKCRIGAKFAASQPRSLAASQPRSLAAEGKLCPNKFAIKHKQTYSHKKPQGTQSLELRSISQRIIKDALTKATLNPFVSLACPAVKLKYRGENV